MGTNLNDDIFEVLLKHAAKDYSEQEVDALMEQYGGDDRLEEHSEAYRKKMNRLFARERRKEHISGLSRHSRPLMKAAIIVFACFVGIGAVSLSVDAFRAKIVNLFRSTNPDYTAVISVENVGFDKENIPEGWTHIYLPSEFPDGFYIENAHASKHSLVVTYADDKGKIIRFNQQIATNKGYAWDTQDTGIQEFELNRQTYYAVEKDGQTNIKWNEDDLFFEVTSNLNLDLLKPIIASLKKVSK